jgi:signal transduction histidine kinase
VQAYPADRRAEEQSLIEQIQEYLAEEDRVFRSAREWKPEERLSRGQAVVSSEIIPKRQRFVAIAQRIEFLNDQQSVAAKQASFAEFGRLQERLTRFLILTLTSGLLLAIGSAVYIMRLERQGRLRYSELVQSRGELQKLSARLVDAQETERRAISRELHDEVGQALGLLLMDAGRLSNQLGSSNETGQQLVGNIKTVAERTVQTVRNMALLLRPSMLDDLGLVPAVEWYAREMSRRGEIEVEVRAENVSEELPDEVKVGVYRIVQEAVNNVQRHAKAKNAVVELEQTGNAIRVKVTDDGSGFDPKRARGMGLLGMEERVKRLGGTIEIDSRPGAGTMVGAELPLASTRA